MAESGMSSGMAEVDIKAMKETLCYQQQLLQNLYTELDQEREAAATAASEALDMILRLQGEKAAVKMEASHYKRMAEEKIGHAEATLEIFEELMNQKEMEMASLELQVQAYKRKLMSLGFDLNASEFETSQQNGENGQTSIIRRLNSLPHPSSKNSLRATLKAERSYTLIPDRKLEQIIEQEVTSQGLDTANKSGDSAFGTLNSYWNQIKRLDEKVKVISSDFKDCEGEKSANLEHRKWKSCSIFSQGSKTTCDQTDSVSSNNMVNDVHDVFEVPQPRENLKVREYWKRALEKLNPEAENRLTKPDSVSDETVESLVKHKPENLKSMLSTNNDIQNAISQNNEGMSIDCNAQAEFQKLYQKIERLEKERVSTIQEIKPSGDGEEQLRLLKEIQSQLRVIQTEIRNSKTKKGTPKDDVCLGRLQEVSYNSVFLPFLCDKGSVFFLHEISLFCLSPTGINHNFFCSLHVKMIMRYNCSWVGPGLNQSSIDF